MRYIVFCFLLFAAFSAQAQSTKPFEGEIHFKVEISGGGEEMELARQFMPSGFLYVLKGNSVFIKTLGAKASSMTGSAVYNGKNNKVFLVHDATKTVYLIKEADKTEEAGEDMHNVPTVVEGEDKKQIAGYDCKHYIITNAEDEASKTEIWVTDAIQLNIPATMGSNMPIDHKIMSVVKGFPLALRTAGAGGLDIYMVAEKVEKKAVNNHVFDMPKGYEVKNFEPTPIVPGGDE